jgi:phage terminase small subunit
MKKQASLDERGLDMRETLFFGHYLANGGDGKKAATAAGYKGDTAKRASQLLKRPVIADLLRRTINQKLSALDAKTDKVLRELCRVAFFDCRKLFRPNGSLIPLTSLDSDTAAAISTVQVGRGGMLRLKFASKISALDLLGRYLGLWDADGKVAGKDSIDQLIEALRNPVQDTPAPSPAPKKSERIM